MDVQQTDQKMERQTYDLWPDVGKLLGLGRNGVYAAAVRGEIRCIRIGRRRLVPKTEVDRLLNSAGANG